MVAVNIIGSKDRYTIVGKQISKHFLNKIRSYKRKERKNF